MLGLSEREFWRLTPRETNALLQARAEDDVANYRAGLPTAAVYNVNRQKRTDKIWSPLDFFGSANEREPMSPDEIGRRFASIGRTVNALRKQKTCPRSGRSKR